MIVGIVADIHAMFLAGVVTVIAALFLIALSYFYTFRAKT